MRKSLIPVILIAVVAALCLSLAYADNDDRTGEGDVAASFGDPVSYNVTGTVIDGSGIEGASIILSSDTVTVTGVTDSSGAFSLSAVPGTYNLAVSKDGYVTKIIDDIVVASSDVPVPTITLTKKTAVTGATVTGYVLRTSDDFPGFSGSVAKITLYYRVNENNTLKANYVKIQDADVNISSNTFTLEKIMVENQPSCDMLVDRCYVVVSSDNYSVSNLSSTCFSVEDTMEYTEAEKTTTYYHLNNGTTTVFEDGETYALGSKMSVSITLSPATGIVSGSVKSSDSSTVKSGVIVIKDSMGAVYGQGNIDSSGKYNVKTYIGTGLTISFSSVGFDDGKITGVTVYDEAVYSHDKNKQPNVTLDKTGELTTIKIYIDGKTSKIEDIGQIRATLYHISNPAETDPTRLTYDTILGEFDQAPLADTDGDKIIGYYIEFRVSQVNCNECFLSINVSGYSVRVVQTHYMESTTTLMNAEDVSGNRLKSDCTSTGVFGAGKTCKVGTGSSDAILIDKATGTVKGDVVTNTDKPTILNGVKVSIIDSDGDTIAYGITADKGTYSITVPTGEYKIRYEIDGYVTYEAAVKVFDEAIYGPEKNVQPTVKLDAVKGEWFGLDLPHALLVLGGIIAILLIIAVLYHRFRILGKKKNSFVEDDDGE